MSKSNTNTRSNIILDNLICLILDFDYTLFDTSTSEQYRTNGNRNIDKAVEAAPTFTLYDGWKDLFQFAAADFLSRWKRSPIVKHCLSFLF